MVKTYTESEKQNALQRCQSDTESIAAISADTGIPKSALYHRISLQKSQEAEQPVEFVRISEYRKLECKLLRMEQIITILKSVDCTVSAPLKYRLYAAEQFSGQYSIHLICDALDLSRGTFYNHVLRNKRDNAWYAKHREDLRIQIQEVYHESNQIFGAEKIAAVIRSNGIPVSVEMVRRLMREMGLYSIRQGAKKMYEDDYKKYVNHVKLNFNASKPNEIWVSDVTYFKFKEHQFYICVIIDLFSRMVIACQIGKTNSTHLIKSALRIAYNNRKPTGDLLFHTDRGGNYRSHAMATYMKSLNITHSFSRAHYPCDNAVVESFLSSMKREELYRTKYRSEAEFRTAVANYIVFYNEKRPHKKLHYKTPLQQEQEFAQKTPD